MRLGILTGGGDCPGTNGVIRALVRRVSERHGTPVTGFLDAWDGVIEGRAIALEAEDVRGILPRGGTILGTRRGSPFDHPDGPALVRRALDSHGLDALVVVGGNGSLTVASMLADDHGLPVVGVPKTIDNDIEGTDECFGFDTALQIATDAIDRLHTTAESHDRIMVIEVMGRDAGWIALHAGVASGSDVILLPEIPFSMESIYERVRDRARRSKRSSLICVSEGARIKGGQQIVARRVETSPDPIRLGGIGQYLAEQIEDATGVESRYTILGHTQRGGTPVAADRVLGTLLGSHAMTLLRQGKVGRMVAVQGTGLADVDLATPAGKQRLVSTDDPLILAARNVGSIFGDE